MTMWAAFDSRRGTIKTFQQLLVFLESLGVAVPKAIRDNIPADADTPLRIVSPPATSALRIYTDGSVTKDALGNPQAGFGVFVGPRDPRNVSRRLPPTDPQSIGRAELLAILEAFNIAHNSHLEIFSDSSSMINCVKRIGTQLKHSFKKK